MVTGADGPGQPILHKTRRPAAGDRFELERRAESVCEAARFKLYGLDPGAEYLLTNLDSGELQTLAGRELPDKGLAVTIPDQPGSAVIVEKKAKGGYRS